VARRRVAPVAVRGRLLSHHPALLRHRRRRPLPRGPLLRRQPLRRRRRRLCRPRGRLPGHLHVAGERLAALRGLRERLRATSDVPRRALHLGLPRRAALVRRRLRRPGERWRPLRRLRQRLRSRRDLSAGPVRVRRPADRLSRRRVHQHSGRRSELWSVWPRLPAPGSLPGGPVRRGLRRRVGPLRDRLRSGRGRPPQLRRLRGRLRPRRHLCPRDLPAPMPGGSLELRRRLRGSPQRRPSLRRLRPPVRRQRGLQQRPLCQRLRPR
jgi:hypothetical protein